MYKIVIGIKLTLFQSLIGRLKMWGTAPLQGQRDSFQSLIGRLKIFTLPAVVGDTPRFNPL